MAQNLVKRYQSKFGIKAKLRGYQLKAANRGVELGNIALLMDPRLGKTRIDIAISGYHWLNSGLKRWVIVCPLIAMSVWKEEILNTLDIPHQVVILRGRSDEKRIELKNWRDDPGKLTIFIMNFEATWRVKKFLYKFNPGKVTIDESHRISNHASKQSKTLHTLGLRAESHSILTGTFLSKVTDCFSQYKFLDPEVFGTVWKDNPRKRQPSFLGRYVATYGYGGHKPETFRHLEELNEKIYSRAFRLTRAEAGGFPTEHTQDLEFTLTNPALKHYKEMEAELRTVVEGHRVNAEIVLTQVLRLQQITGGFLPVLRPDEDQATNVPLGSDRLKALAELLDEYPTEEPLIIFAKFRYEVTAVTELVMKAGRTCNQIYGGLKGRDQAIKDFQSGKFDTCVVQIRAGGISVDLSRADTAIFYSTSSYRDYEQAKARIIARTGGKKSFLRLKARGTHDERILEALDTNTSVVEKILSRTHLLES